MADIEKELTTQVQKTINVAPATGNAPLAEKVVQGIKDNPNIAVLPIKPWYLQQQNLVTIVAGLAVIASLFGLKVDAETQLQIVTAIGTLYGIYVTIRKNLVGGSVTPTAAKAAMPDDGKK